MNVVKCESGHFFDADKYAECPHCNPASVASESRPKAKVVEGGSVLADDHGPSSEAVASALAQTDQLKCPNCGRNVQEGDAFCLYCGAKLDAPIEAKPAQAAPVRTPIDGDVTESLIITPQAEPEVVEVSPRTPVAEPVAEEPPVVEVIDLQSPEPEPEPEPVTLPEEEPAPSPSWVEEQEEEPAQSLKDAMVQATGEADGKTIGFFSLGAASKGEKTLENEPVVGWLVCLKGNHFGESFVIVSGRNSIGRLSSNKIALTRDPSVSREHQAAITYDPKGRVFYAQPGEGSSLSYLNGELLMETKAIMDGDKLEFGEGQYLLVVLCGEDFSWEDYLE